MKTILAIKLICLFFSPEYIGCIHELSRGFKEKQLEYQHGAILSLANTFAPKANEIQNLSEFKVMKLYFVIFECDFFG